MPTMLFGPRQDRMGALGLAAITFLLSFSACDAQAVLEHAGFRVNRAKPDEIGAIRGNFTVWRAD